MYWSLLALAGACFSMMAGLNGLKRKTSVHLSLFLIFAVFTLSCACIRIVGETAGEVERLIPVWACTAILIGVLTSFVIYRHFYLLVGDFGGIAMEGGVILMVFGLMSLIGENGRWLPIIGFLTLGAMIVGYLRLETLLRIRYHKGDIKPFFNEVK